MSDRAGRGNGWRVGLDGTPAEQLTDVVGELGEFRWSPDGRRLAYLVTDPPAEEELRQVQEKRDARVVGEAYRFARLYRLDLDAAAGRVGQPLTPPHLEVGGHRRRAERRRVRLVAGRLGDRLFPLAVAVGRRLGAG